MSDVVVNYGTSADTYRFSSGIWAGITVLVREAAWDLPLCPSMTHDLAPLTYFGEPSPHALYCWKCCGVAKRPDSSDASGQGTA